MSQYTEVFSLHPFNGQFVPPRYTTSERDGLATEVGSIIFNTTSNKLQCYDGANWNDLF